MSNTTDADFKGLNIKMDLILNRLELLENNTLSKMTRELIKSMELRDKLNKELDQYRNGK